ncbi:MAG: hypothetical protein GW859_08860 [Sphingomonadales bacterium]|nr:hypothetical protein [Sphingomonadales bacterium]
MPVDSEICAIAIDLIADCGSEAATIANSKALDAFWRGDMPDCRFWTHAGRLIDSHFAGQCAQEYRRDLRDVIATLAI